MKLEIKDVSLHTLKLKISDAFYENTGIRIPYSYIVNSKNKAFILHDKKEIFGSFVIVNQQPFRTLQQIPWFNTSFNQKEISPNWNKYVSEITCYFLKKDVPLFYRILFKIKFVLAVIDCDSKYFVYSYHTKDKKLEKYYDYGSPFRVYCGKTINMNDIEKYNDSWENVEILTEYGIIKIFLKSLWKQLRRKIK